MQKKHKKYNESYTYKDAPEEIDLGSFLAKSIEEAQLLEELALKERQEAKKMREHKENIDPHALYAVKRQEEFTKAKAYKVFIMKSPDETCLMYGENKGQARYRGAKYFRDTMHPQFPKCSTGEILGKVMAHRVPDLDKYALKERAPIPDLLKSGFILQCEGCHNRQFRYEDYEGKRCFVFEGDGNPIAYAEGFILCYDCAKKYGYI